MSSRVSPFCPVSILAREPVPLSHMYNACCRCDPATMNSPSPENVHFFHCVLEREGERIGRGKSFSARVCVCVCVCVCCVVQVCMHTDFPCVNVCGCMCVIHTCSFIDTHAHTCTHTCIHMYVHVHAHTCMRMYACMCVNVCDHV